MNDYKLQLPNPPENFEGRSRELSRLSQFFWNQHIIIIAGIAGMGKTSFALAFAKLINSGEDFSDYHDSVLWVHCEENWKIDTLLQEINRWLMDKGIDNFGELARNSEAPLEKRLLQLVNVLESGNFVLFLDDFHLVEDDSTRLIIRFCKKYLQKGKLIITTRRRVKLSAIDRVDILERRLDGLGQEECQDLLRHLLVQHEITNVSDDALQNIYEKTKGHPFSLKLFVSLLITGDSTIDELLAGSGEFEEEIGRYLIEKTFMNLPQEEKNFLNSMALFRIPVPPSAMEWLVPELDIRALRITLGDKYLIEVNADKLLTMHGLLRIFCQQQISDEQKRHLHTKCAEFFLKEEKNAANLLEAHYHLIEGQNLEKAEKTAEIALDIMEKSGKLQELFQLIERTIEISEKISPKFSLHKANILRIWGKNAQAAEILSLLTLDPDDYIKAKAMISLSKVLGNKGDYAEGQKNLEDAITIFKKLGKKMEEADAITQLGVTMLQTNNLKQAEIYFQQAISMAQHLKNPAVEATALSNLGSIYLRRQSFDEALKYYEGTLKLRDDDNSLVYCITQHNIGVVYFEQGQLDKALLLLEEILERRQELQDRKGLAYTLNLLGEIYYVKDKLDKAAEYFFQCRRLADGIEEELIGADARLNFALLDMGAGEYDRALGDLEGALFLYEKHREYSSCSLTRGLISEIFISQNRLELVDEQLKQLNDLPEKDIPETRLMNLWIQSLLARAKGENKEAERFQDEMEKIQGIRNSTLMRLKKHFLKSNEEGRYELYTTDGMRRISVRELEEIRKNKEQYSLFVDLVEKEVLEKDKGTINILKKRTLAPLFLYLVKNAGEEFAAKDLFSQIWGRPFDFETDGITIRVNISRLRTLIEPTPDSAQYIKMSTGGGKYFFDRSAKFCLICQPGDLEE